MNGSRQQFGLSVVEDDDDLDKLFQIEQLQFQKRRTRVGSEGGVDEKEETKKSICHSNQGRGRIGKGCHLKES